MATEKTKAADKKGTVEKKGGTVKIRQVASAAGRYKDQKQTLIGLRLNKIGRVSVLEDTPAVRGMINKVQHLVEIEQ